AQYYIWNLNPKVSGIDCNSLQYRLTTHSVGPNKQIPEFQGGQTVTVYKVGGGTEPAYLYHVDYLLRSIWRQDYKTDEIIKIM
ncbi:MAG: hypothetical protein MJ055_03970, partial [Phascolarctobacterium sp.]|nr:hypothetical protein [Phascolarctobacterium sp.]